MICAARVTLAAAILRIPLRETFKHAAAERFCGESLCVEAAGSDGFRGIGEGCPRSYVTGETPRSCTAFFNRHRDSIQRYAWSVESLRDWVDGHTAEIDRNPAAWCAIEIALLDLLGHREGRSLEALLGLPPVTGTFRYTAVLGDSNSKTFLDKLNRYSKAGFSDYKLKLSGDLKRDRQRIAALKELAGTVRVDANNLWTDPEAAIQHVALLELPLAGLEEPLRPAGRIVDLARLADAAGTPVILDEGLLRMAQLEDLAESPQRWIVNLRVSKMGGLLRSLQLLERGRALGLRFIVGAQVGETSLLTRVALPVASAAGDALVGQEGAFGSKLLQHDPCKPELCFGAAGELRPEALLAEDAPGLGLEVAIPDRWIEPLH